MSGTHCTCPNIWGLLLTPAKLNFNMANWLGTYVKWHTALKFLKRNLYSCKCEIKTHAYLIYVCPVLEYVLVLGLPKQNVIVSVLVIKESVKWGAAIFALKNYSATSSMTKMIKKVKWNSLNHRRDTIQAANDVHQIADLNYTWLYYFQPWNKLR